MQARCQVAPCAIHRCNASCRRSKGRPHARHRSPPRSAANATAAHRGCEPAAWCASRLGSLRRCGRIFRRLALSDGLFLILEAQLQLLNRQLFGPTAELMTRQACDQQPKLVVLGVQLAQHLLQRDRIVRQCVRVDLHTAVMNDAAASLPEPFCSAMQIIRPIPVDVAAPAPSIRSRRAKPQVVRRSARSGRSCRLTARRTDRARAAWSACTVRSHKPFGEALGEQLRALGDAIGRMGRRTRPIVWRISLVVRRVVHGRQTLPRRMDHLLASAVQAWINRPSPCAYRSHHMRDKPANQTPA